MDYLKLFDQIKAGEFHPLYLLHGTEAHIRNAALTSLRQALVPGELQQLNEMLLDNPDADTLIAACETLPMLGERRLVVVRDCALLLSGKVRAEAEQGEKMAAYFDRLPPYTTLVFLLSVAADGRNKLTIALKKKGCEVKFEPLDDIELVKWIRKALRRYKKQISDTNAKHLAFTAGRDLTQLTGEIEKLTAYVGQRVEVSEQDIDLVVTKSLECTVFKMVDAIVEKRERDAFRLLSKILEEGQPRLGVLAMLLRQFRILMHTALMQQGGVARSEQIARLGIPGFAYARALKQLRGFSPERLKQCVALCVDTDFAIKSGKMREEVALDRAMLMLCQREGA